MNGNRGQYTSAPMHNLRKKRPAPQPAPAAAGESAPRPALDQGQRRYSVLSMVMCLGLPLLFLASLIPVPTNFLRYLFLASGVAALIAMWALGAFAKSARVTLTVIYLALMLVVGLYAYLTSQQAPVDNGVSREGVSSVFANGDPSAFGAAALNTTPVPEENANSAEAAAMLSAAQLQLQGFMDAWALGNVPQMLDYVLPSWKLQQQSAETALWQLTLDSRPVGEYEVESTLGGDTDTSRTIVIKVHMNERNAGADLVYKRIQVIMFRSGQTWYVDPNSLNGLVIDESAELAAANKPMIGTTIAPTNTPAPENAYSGVKLYYNTDRGKYYHTTATCEAVSQEYWPLTGVFPIELLNSPQYAQLMPCPKCNAPARTY